MASDELAGPRVATILVLRMGYSCCDDVKKGGHRTTLLMGKYQ